MLLRVIVQNQKKRFKFQQNKLIYNCNDFGNDLMAFVHVMLVFIHFSELMWISSQLIKIMAGRSVRLFRSTHKYYHTMGFYSLQANKPRLLNFRNVQFLICYAQLFVPTFSFIVFQANSFKEYGRGFYASTTSTLSPSYYLAQMLQKQNFERLTKEFEDFIEQSGYDLNFSFFAPQKHFIRL